MKLNYLIVLLAIISACQQKQEKKVVKNFIYEVDTTLNVIFDSANVEGSILILDYKSMKFISNNFERAKTGFLPASTFKIPNTIIGLETRVVNTNEVIFKWDGQPRRIEAWEKDMDLKQAFRSSCVPCYQELARKVGATRMKMMLEKLIYGNMKVDSSNIDIFWLEGESKISQMEQVDFLERFYFKKLPISDSTHQLMKNILIEEEGQGYVLSAKTGWAIRNDNNIGWYVGYIEKSGEVYFFAVNIEPRQSFNMDMFPMIRKQITLKSLDKLGIIN